MLACDAIEQLHPSTLQPVCTNRGGDLPAFGGQVGVQESVTDLPHREPRLGYMMPQALFASMAQDRSDQCVSAAAQCPKLDGRTSTIAGLVEPAVAAHQDLVGTDDERLRVVRRNLPGLHFGQPKRSILRTQARHPGCLLDRGFVNLCRLGRES